MRNAVQFSGQRVFDVALENPEYQGMGTTLTTLLVLGRMAHIAHVGDSRLYTIRDGLIEQITDDHTLVNEQMKKGLITEEEARESKLRNVITRSVGFEKEVEVDLVSLPVRKGDLYLICSDGLTGAITDEELGQTVLENYYAEVPDILVYMVNVRGGEDNVTVLLIYVEEDKTTDAL